MNDPAESLRAYIESKYTLETVGVAKANVQFTLVDYTTESSPQSPHIIVKQSGFRRLQQAEPDLYEFTFIVQVAVFVEFRKAQDDISDLYSLYWEIVNHLKLMLDDFAQNDIAGWDSAIVDGGSNVGYTYDVVPEPFIFNLSVKAIARWTA
jgi:hypothetical protein